MLPAELAGKYELRGTLGAGAMGTVLDAFDRMIERRVAVKLVRLPGGGDAEAEEAHARFRREAQAAGRLSHPNIVGVYDYGENADTAWIVMELVEGGTLKALLDKGERFPVAEIVRVMDQVLAALAYSHGRGVVHRDIKPANIMLAADRTVKIADFGIARIESSTMTQVGTVMGTPSYMAPEQLRGEPVDARADIWAAGVVLYQLLTGEKPFDGGYSALMHRVLTTEPPPPSQLAVSAPRAFDAVVARALAKRPDDRFPNAAAFAEAIRAAAGGGAEEAAPFGGFAGAGKLPGLDDGTMVAGPAPAAPSRPTPSPAAPAPSPKPAPGGSKAPLVVGGVLALAAAGAAAFFLVPREAAPPPAPAIIASAPTPPPAPAAAPPAAAPAPIAAAEPAPAPMPQPAPAAQAPASAPTPAPAPAPAAIAMAPAPVAAPPSAPAPLAPATVAPAPSQPPPAALPPPAAALPTPAAPPPAPPAASQPAPPPLAAPAQQAPAPRPAPPPVAQPAAPQASAPQAAAPQPAAPAPQPAAPPATAPQATTPQVTAPATSRPPAAEERPASSAAPVIAALPVPPPAAPTAPAPVVMPAPRPNFAAAAAAAASAAPCSLLHAAATDRGVSVEGVLRRGGEAQVRRALGDAGVPAAAAALQLVPFDGPYCGALDVIRQVASEGGAPPLVDIIGRQPLQKGDLLRLDVTLPPRAGHLYVSYLMKSNEIVHLVPSHPQPAGARVRLGEPRPGFPGWEVDEPYGTDMIIVFSSERPLFPQPRPQIEPLDDFLPALASALRAAREQGVRVAARALVVETVERR
jgi:hypothetical protein